MQFFNLESGLYCAQSGVFLTKFGYKLLLFHLLSMIMCERVGKKLLGRSALCIKESSDPITFLKTMLIV